MKRGDSDCIMNTTQPRLGVISIRQNPRRRRARRGSVRRILSILCLLSGGFGATHFSTAAPLDPTLARYSLLLMIPLSRL